MSLTRRGFLERLGIGLVATAALVAIPTRVLQSAGLTEPARRYAIEYLQKIFSEHHRGDWHRLPTVIHVGRELCDAYEGELAPDARFVATDYAFALCFKGARVVPVGRGWTAKVVA